MLSIALFAKSNTAITEDLLYILCTSCIYAAYVFKYLHSRLLNLGASLCRRALVAPKKKRISLRQSSLCSENRYT